MKLVYVFIFEKEGMLNAEPVEREKKAGIEEILVGRELAPRM
jgi:hypothetical protein